MIIFPVNPRRFGRAAFTLVEVMIGATLGSIVLLGVLTTFVMLMKHGLAAANYSMMESQSRRAFEQLGLDARMASGLTTGTNAITFTFSLSAVPAAYTTAGNMVTYVYDSTNRLFYLVPGDGTVLTPQTVLIRDVSSVVFYRSDSSGNSTTSDSLAKHIQVAITTSGLRVTSTESMVSAAFTMRNKL